MNRGRGVVAYALAASMIGVVLLVTAAPNLVNALAHGGSDDGQVNYIGASAFLDGISPYDFTPEQFRDMGLLGFGHPPTMPLWFLPFAGIGLGHLSGALGLLVIALLLVHCVLITTELGVAASLPTAFLIFAATMSTWWMLYHLSVSQTSEVIAFAYLMAWYFLRRKKDVAGGVVLGLACTMKLFPGLLIVYLAYRRRWRAVAAAAIAFLVPAAIVTIRFGVSCWPKFLAQQKPIADYWMGSPINESLQGIVLRWFRSWEPFSTTSGVATLIATSMGVALLALFVVLDRRARRRDPDAFDLPFMLISMLSIFLNPWVWGHYGVFLLLPLGLVLRELTRGRQSIGAALGVLAVAGIVVLLRVVDIHEYMFQWIGRQDHPDPKIAFYAVLLWLPWVLTIVVLGALVTRGTSELPAPAQS